MQNTKLSCILRITNWQYGRWNKMYSTQFNEISIIFQIKILMCLLKENFLF